jgi:hypothetical protein
MSLCPKRRVAPADDGRSQKKLRAIPMLHAAEPEKHPKLLMQSNVSPGRYRAVARDA